MPDETTKTIGGVLSRSWRDMRRGQVMWDEAKHPRGAGGQFGSGIGGGLRTGSRRVNPERRAAIGPSKLLYTGNPNEAAKAIAEGREVVLRQADEVSTLLDRLAAIVKEAEAKGDKAPRFDLCLVSLRGSNLFCAEHKGIRRVEMPQLSGVPQPGSPADRLPKNDRGKVDLGPAFLEHLAAAGIGVEEKNVLASHLRASQREMDGAKVGSMARRMRAGTFGDHPPIFTSRDNYVIDGHHRWASTVAVDSDDGQLGDLTMGVHRVDLDILDVLAEATAFTKAMGISGVPVHKGNRQVPTAALDPDTGEPVLLRPYAMELFAGSVLSVSTPDGDTYLDVEKCDCQGDGFEVVDTADGEGGVAFTIDGSRVLWAPTAKAFGVEALGADLVFTDAEVGEEVTFPAGFTGQPWPASDAGKVFLRPDVAKAGEPGGGLMGTLRGKWAEAKHPRGFGGKFGHGGGVKKPTAGPQRAPGPLRAGKAPNVPGNLPGGPPSAPNVGGKMDLGAAVAPADMQIDSLGKHGGPAGLTPERKALHDAIVAEHLKGHEASPNPEATFLGGGPAAGKSTVLGSAPAKGVIIDSDHIKSMLPEYQQMLDANAAGYVHEESSLLAKRIQSEAATKQLDFTLDGTGDSSIEKLRSKVNEARQGGQTTKGLYVTVDTEEAVRRAEERGKKTGRVVPSSVIRDTHAMVSRTLPKAIAEDLFDELTVWDTSTTPPTLVGEKKKGGKWGIHDAAAWQRFVDKGTEVAKAADAAGPESEFTGEDAIRMLRAIVAGQTLEESGVPDTPTHRARWDAYAADVAKIKAAGQVVEIPYDWTMTPDDDAGDDGDTGTPPATGPQPPPTAKARRVRTPEGARAYGLPVGSPIGGAAKPDRFFRGPEGTRKPRARSGRGAGVPMPKAADIRRLVRAEFPQNRDRWEDIEAEVRTVLAGGNGSRAIQTLARQLLATDGVTKAAAGPPSEVDPVKRYTLGPLYPAAPHRVTREDLDAHEEFVTAADLQESVWDYTKSGDRKIRLQHGSDTLIIGEWVELMCMPAPVTVDLALPGGETITKSFAVGTPFMGVIWTTLGWELVEKGLIRGYSFGGSAAKMIVELER